MNIKTIIVAITLATIPSITFGANEFKSVMNQIDTLVSTLKQNNPSNELMVSPVIELASQGETDYHSFIVPGNVQVVVMGVCDQNCQGFGIKVIDENGRTVGEDNGMDGSNFAAVKGNSRGSESREIKVFGTMYRCRAQSCVYGLTIVQQPLNPGSSF